MLCPHLRCGLFLLSQRTEVSESCRQALNLKLVRVMLCIKVL